MSAPFDATGYQYFNCEYSPLVPTLRATARRGRFGRALLLVDVGQIALALVVVGHAVLHPVRRRRAEQVVIEVLGHVHRPVLLVVALAKAVLLAVVDEHVR